MTYSFRQIARACALSVFFALCCCVGCHVACANVDLTGPNPPANAIWLDSIPLDLMTQDWGSPQASKNVDGTPIVIGTTAFVHGIGTHANSDFVVDLHGTATRFQSDVGVDAGSGKNGSITFAVVVDGLTKFTTSVIRGGDSPTFVDVDLRGAKILELKVGDGGDGIGFDHADWGGATITIVPGGALPTPYIAPVEPARLNIPAISSSAQINYPRIIGSTPGRPFLFMIPATGARPLKFSAKGLPAGLVLDPNTGIITGSLVSAGSTDVAITVRNGKGVAKSTLTIVGGTHMLALTPPMGWNSWNVWAGNVDQPKVEAAADVMISSGLAAHGFQYVNVDDTWEAPRDANGFIKSNNKFPDMKAMADYIHAKGLKAGLYSSPGPTTCAGYPASYQHEDQDAQTYANWGFDYLKYDWCSYSQIDPTPDIAGYEKPYAVMRASLDKVDRDILFSFCQYGMGNVWEWGQQIGGNCWRTTGDIRDSWSSVHNIYESQSGHEEYAGPGHWNDPDMLTVGIVGWGNTHPSHLTPNEQILHITMWCLLSAPLLIGCDMAKLDPFTLALLTNDEAIAIDQDSLGKPAAKMVSDADGGEIWARPLSDGTEAVGLVNPTPTPIKIRAYWHDLKLNGPQSVRDLWLHQNVGTFNSMYTVTVPTHGAVLLKVTPSPTPPSGGLSDGAMSF